jgi:hypothetical protein
MIEVVTAAFTGNYPLLGRVEDADCVIGQSFGMRKNKAGEFEVDPVNLELAHFAIEKVGIELPTLLQIEIANGFKQETGQEPTLTIDKHRTEGKYLDCWEVLDQAQAYMKEHKLNHPLLLAQAHHIGRFTVQALSHGMEPVVLPGLTEEFDKKSTQWWTRSLSMWAVRETIGLPVLDKTGRL